MGDAVETVMTNYAHIIAQVTNDSLELMANTILGNQPDEEGEDKV